MADKNSFNGDQENTEEGNSIQFKLMLAIVGLGMLIVILKGAGVF